LFERSDSGVSLNHQIDAAKILAKIYAALNFWFFSFKRKEHTRNLCSLVPKAFGIGSPAQARSNVSLHICRLSREKNVRNAYGKRTDKIFLPYFFLVKTLRLSLRVKSGKRQGVSIFPPALNFF
jgi:hypothetical protein